MSRRAVILAGGKGTRLQPYTTVFPKPLMPIGEYPILEIVVRQLVRHGFDRITIAVNHQAELIKAFFGIGDRWAVPIDYSIEDRPLGTMGPLRLIADLPAHVLVMNGDILTDLDFAEFHDSHVRSNDVFTISSYVREHLVDYGVLDTCDGRLTAIREKPTERFEVSMGAYMISSHAVDFIPAGVEYGFDSLMHDLLAAKQRVSVRRFSGHWLDIGRPEDYRIAIEMFEKHRRVFLPE